MAKIRLTKNELKKQKDALKRFNRYLPTLMLKKQQLQGEIRLTDLRLKELHSTRENLD
ncbi:MAG: V-type ATP synthase subunit D, partial [Treponema sp.]|nr:V-type ATP synthase subunit D [Treponema sp.]